MTTTQPTPPSVAAVAALTDDDRKQVARALLSIGTDEQDLRIEPLPRPLGVAAAPKLRIPFPDGLAPQPVEIGSPPSPGDPLPRADVVVITWTSAENDGLADVLTPGYGRKQWYRYSRGFAERYAPNIRQGAPALAARRLASYFPCTIGDVSVLNMKSELHLNQDGRETGEGRATLPVADLFRQIIAEVRPQLILTVGTAGGVYDDHDLGDVVVTRAARFRLTREFRNETFNDRTYTSDWQVPTARLGDAQALMHAFADRLTEPAFVPPTLRYAYDGPPITTPPNEPDIKLEGRDMPAFHPILTTDYFEFGTSQNRLHEVGCAVEMGDAVLGLVCHELDSPPQWAVVRNLSDPQINADVPTGRGALNMQTHWAVWYYEAFGYWTSVMGALATWAIVAGL